MAKTKISDLGNSICVNNEKEHLIPALGNGTAVPGDACYRSTTTGRVVASNTNTAKFFEGILKESPVTGTETAIVADVPCSLVVPKSGHRYRVRIKVNVGNKEVGASIIHHATEDYIFDHTANIADGCAYLALPSVAGDTVADVVWK